MVFYPPIAQLVEQLPLKQTVGGSNPSGRTRAKRVVDQASKLLCSREEFEQRSDNFSVEKFSELAPSPRSATGATRGEGESPSGRTRAKSSDQKIYAGVAKLADALALGASGIKSMEVQVLSPAHKT